MDLILDGDKKSFSDKEKLVTDVINYIQDIENNNGVVKHFYINGKHEDDFWQALQNRFEDYEIDRVEVITANTEELVDETLNTVINYIDKLNPYIVERAKELKKGETELDTLFHQLEESLKWVTEALSGLQANLQDYSLEDKIKSLFENIREIETVMNKRDMNALGEFLEKDLKKCLLDVRARLAGIYERRKGNK